MGNRAAAMKEGAARRPIPVRVCLGVPGTWNQDHRSNINVCAAVQALNVTEMILIQENAEPMQA